MNLRGRQVINQSPDHQQSERRVMFTEPQWKIGITHPPIFRGLPHEDVEDWMSRYEK